MSADGHTEVNIQAKVFVYKKPHPFAGKFGHEVYVIVHSGLKAEQKTTIEGSVCHDTHQEALLAARMSIKSLVDILAAMGNLASPRGEYIDLKTNETKNFYEEN